MKCKYKYCKNNGEVDKKNAIKNGNCYYCKECYDEKLKKENIEKIILEKLPYTQISIIRKIINQLLNEKGFQVDYILYVVNKIHKENLTLNSPFGIGNYCSNNFFQKEWKIKNIDEKFIELKKETKDSEFINEKVVFTIKQNKKWTDIL